MEQSEDTALQIERCVPGWERPRDKALEFHCGRPHPELETSVWTENQEKGKKLDGDGNKRLFKKNRLVQDAKGGSTSCAGEPRCRRGILGGWWVTVRGAGGDKEGAALPQQGQQEGGILPL